MASSGASSETGGAIGCITTKAPKCDPGPGDFERAIETLPLHELDERC